MSGGIKLNYYILFGIKPSADNQTIKKKYRALVKQFHPDMKTGDEEHFKLINQAYETLIDPQRRALYNISLFAGSLADITEQTVVCHKCEGKGFWFKKVAYGKYKVDSKIVCTLCIGTGIIKNVTKD